LPAGNCGDNRDEEHGRRGPLSACARIATGPSMYEMEGPVPVSPRPACRLPGRHPRRDSRPAALVTGRPAAARGVAVAPPPWRASCPAAASGVTRPLHSSADCSASACRRALLRRRSHESVNAGHLTRPGVPRVTPGADPVFSSERFLRPVPRGAQGLSRITSRFFRHPQDAQRLSPVHEKSPRVCAQDYPHPWGQPAGTRRGGLALARVCEVRPVIIVSRRR
jgi:hypothetical protein